MKRNVLVTNELVKYTASIKDASVKGTRCDISIGDSYGGNSIRFGKRPAN